MSFCVALPRTAFSCGLHELTASASSVRRATLLRLRPSTRPTTLRSLSSFWPRIRAGAIGVEKVDCSEYHFLQCAWRGGRAPLGWTRMKRGGCGRGGGDLGLSSPPQDGCPAPVLAASHASSRRCGGKGCSASSDSGRTGTGKETDVTACAVGIAVVLIVLTAVRISAAAAYLKASRKNRCRDLLHEPAPHVSVLMPLRGADPMLRQAIHSVLRQDYPSFDFWIIVDSSEDPGWAAVHDALKEEDEASNVFVRELVTKRPRCSLLCSAVLQFLEEVKERSEIIAFCASDGIVPPHWLRHMVVALQAPKVGATLGNRWFAPPEGRWGSLVRYLWNVSAAVYMWMYEIPWSGAIALRTADIERSGLPQRWERAMVEDAHVGEILQKIGLDVKFVPELIVLNREEIDLAGCFRFL
ncbi:MAG TPA: glycosyltransferase family 2 protein, partial [Planctomycetaceae bacterium]|nr:glycosyltransferase family 2 protein [Planctomycetaceae bacterium]